MNCVDEDVKQFVRIHFGDGVPYVRPVGEEGGVRISRCGYGAICVAFDSSTSLVVDVSGRGDWMDRAPFNVKWSHVSGVAPTRIAGGPPIASTRVDEAENHLVVFETSGIGLALLVRCADASSSASYEFGTRGLLEFGLTPEYEPQQIDW